MNYRYLKDSDHSREAVEFDTAGTTCIVDVDLLLCGINKFPCGNGNNEQLTLEKRYEILKFIEQERGKIIHKAGPKSMEDWENSGLGSFDEYFLPGDTVTEDVYNNFLDILPPATLRQNLLQVGEPSSHEKDPETGKYRATYLTFARVNGEWYYAGECFIGETTNRRTRLGRLVKQLYEIETLLCTFIATAKGDALDRLGINRGIQRAAGETDDEYRERLKGEIYGTQ